MGNKGHSDEVSEENEEPVIEHGGKVIHVIKQGGKKINLAQLCSCPDFVDSKNCKK